MDQMSENLSSHLPTEATVGFIGAKSTIRPKRGSSGSRTSSSSTSGVLTGSRTRFSHHVTQSTLCAANIVNRTRTLWNNAEINSANILWRHSSDNNNIISFIRIKNNNNNNKSSCSDFNCHKHSNRAELQHSNFASSQKWPQLAQLATKRTNSSSQLILSINVFIIAILFVAVKADSTDLRRDDRSSSPFGSRRATINPLPVTGSISYNRHSSAVSRWKLNPSLDSARSSKFSYELMLNDDDDSPVAQFATSNKSQRTAPTDHSSHQNQNKTDKDKLASIHGQLSELRRQLELELSLERRQMVLGSPCSSASDCSKHIAQSHCELNNFTCACLPLHVQYNSTTCLSPSLLGYECLIDAQCQRKVTGSFCSSAGTCACHSKFVPYRKDKCLPASNIDDYCLTDQQCRLADKHSHCKWKIYNVYGHCKCPPNYKQIVTNSSSSTTIHQPTTTTTVRCAPRLGDSCLDTDECLLATRNSVCREPRSSDKLLISWRSSDATSRKCYCAQGFSESADKLECRLAPAVTHSSLLVGGELTTQAAELALSAPNSMNAKHQYEFVISSASGGSQTQEPSNSQEFDIRPTDSQQQPTASTSLVAATFSTSPPTTTTTTATTTVSFAQRQTKPQPTLVKTKPPTTTTTKPVFSNTTGSAPFSVGRARVSSLGKPCSSKLDCQLRDRHSDCVGGVCECIRPTDRCSANSTGCHKDTFQCRNGQCISWYFVCDQFKNCDDGSDEDECATHHCPPEAFQCDSGACLARGKVCNGKRDCADGSDEHRCTTSAAAAAAADSGSFTSSGHCHPKAFACDNGQCLPAYVFCNAVEDCSDGSDENESICERVWPKRKWQPITAAAAQNASSFVTGAGAMLAPQQQPVDSPVVRSDKLAIDRLLAASLAARTPDKRGHRRLVEQAARTGRRLRGGPDARRRHHRAPQVNSGRGQCPKSAFTCRNGKCRSSAILCSGVDGCGDNSDEDRCEVCQCEAP